MAETSKRYKIITKRSQELAQRLSRSIPGGNTRSLAHFPPYPLAISHGCGCRVWDVDGNGFVDLLNNYTATVHGHAVPAINEAMSHQAALGTVFPAPAEAQAELAERIVGRRSEEHTSELQSRQYLVCRLLLEKKNKNKLSNES